jgi:carboxylate-amine ligase
MGSGGDRPLKVFRETHDPKAVVDHVAAETKAGL